MNFAICMEVMCAIRRKSPNYLCDKLRIDNAVMALIRKGEVVPVANLEKHIRQELDWPSENDDLLEKVELAAYPKDEAAPVILTVPLVEENEPSSTIPPAIRTSQVLKKKMGRPRKARPEPETEAVTAAVKPPDPYKKHMSMAYLQRPGIADEGATGSSGAVHGSVVG